MPMGGSLASSNANQARLASASATLPRRAARTSRRGTTRSGGSSTASPALTSTSHGPEICLEQNGTIVRLEAIGASTHRYLMHVFGEEYRQLLDDWALLYRLELPIQTPLLDLAQTIATSMQASRFSYRFRQTAVARWPLEYIYEGRLHRCQTDRIQALFPMDIQPEQDENAWECDSQGQAMPDESLTDEEDAQSIANTVMADDRIEDESGLGVPSELSIATLSIESFPPRLVGWGASSTPWSPPPVSTTSYLPHEITTKVYDEAQESLIHAPSTLVIQGPDIHSMATLLLAKIRVAVEERDFTLVLAQERTFERTEPFSLGHGIESEVFDALPKLLINEGNWAQYLKEIDGGYYSLQCLTPMQKHIPSLPEERLQQSHLFLLIIYNLDLSCLTPAFIGEYYPSLRTRVLDWLQLGPSGNPAPFNSHFMSYHDAPILRGFPDGPEAFLRRILTPDLSLEAVLRRVQFFSSPDAYPHLANLRIALRLPTVDYEPLIVRFLGGQGIPCPYLRSTLDDICGNIINLEEASSPMFRTRILLWASTGSPILNNLNRRTISIWAVGDEDGQYVHLTELEKGIRENRASCGEEPLSSDDLRAQALQSRKKMVEQGVISFRTCFHSFRFPASFIAGLARVSYDPEAVDKPKSFEQAFDNWLFTACLTSIGEHSQI
ncbi:hypothetical protein H0H93_006801 [Arthromyces matolae]|nr:hypothetical protein H0H93_006801 [Arthromyces matolae]